MNVNSGSARSVFGIGREDSGGIVNASGKGMMNGERQSSDGSMNCKNVALATNWRKLFSVTVD